jgi:ubiquinone/menaquinone biosynthesis C-methylase UbiE
VERYRSWRQTIQDEKKEWGQVMDSLKMRVQEYWDSHHLGSQFLTGDSARAGSSEYFVELDRAMNRWAYKEHLIDSVSSEFCGGSLLEVGCGQGCDLVKFARRGMNVFAIDLAPTVADMARAHLKAYGLQGTVLQGDAENLMLASDRFDVVYSCGVLQHTPSIEQAVGEIRRVLRTGGLAIVILYYRYSWFNLLKNVGRVNVEFEDKDPPIGNTYTKRMLKRIFSQFERVDIQLEYCYPTPTPRSGLHATLYNRILIPCLEAIPNAVIRHFGWHVVVKAQK